ncbi:MAG TPA: CocE/NonD family hydrolase C-terminal non-catalytic domain-containing protein, partial [Burkholderiales bacterium]|nr:CocE/NonD family hydrolase C-terminal non-catalytic domain-containing protein [Burkholderiales bacterium]
IYELDVELWPTCIVVPAGYRVALTIRGKDYEFDGPPIEIPHAFYPFTGVGPFFHTHPQDRPPAIFETINTLHFGAAQQPYLLLPVIPPR